MKNAFSYIRISTKDQSNFSIEGQIETNQKYANQNQVIILEQFIDDGFSAKNFDRPSWKDLYSLLKKHRNKIDFLLVAKYDRLIRNAAEGLAMLEKIEDNYNVKVISTTECYFIDPHSPAFFKFRADMFVNAEFEYRVIRDRSKFGNWKARSSGRYITRAPIGYQNTRDDENKPIIVPSLEADQIRKVFDLYLRGFGFAQIKESTGIQRASKSAIKRILENPTYAGMIKVAAYRDNPETLVDGIHQALISKEKFWRVQQKLTDGNQQNKNVPSEKLPLRGYLKCADCFHVMTGSKSKGRSAYYYYYRCEHCSKKNVNADKVEHWIEDTLKSLSINIPLDYWNHYFKKAATNIIATKNRDWRAATKELKSLELDIDKLEQKYIEEDLDKALYTKWRSRYEAQRNDLQNKLNESKLNLSIDPEHIKRVMSRFSELYDIYQGKDSVGRQTLLDLIMIGGLYTHKDRLGTAKINSLFITNDMKFNYLQIGKISNVMPISAGSSKSTPNGTYREPGEVWDLIHFIKSA